MRLQLLASFAVSHQITDVGIHLRPVYNLLGFLAHFHYAVVTVAVKAGEDASTERGRSNKPVCFVRDNRVRRNVRDLSLIHI